MPYSQWDATHRELALLSADTLGVQTFIGQFGRNRGLRRRERRELLDLIDASDELYMVIDPRVGLHILDMNEAYAAATLTTRHRAAGEKLFEQFPDNPETPTADGVINLFDSLQRAAQTGLPHTMAVQRYDVRDASGCFVERNWLPTNIPVYDDDGRLIYLLHHVRQV